MSWWIFRKKNQIVDAANEVDGSTTDPSTDLQSYLSYYKTLKSPGYAVLITGDWGVGKTFQVKQALRSDNPAYVSLYGAATTEEIHAQVFAAMFPGKSAIKAMSERVGQAGKDIGGFFALTGLVPQLTGAVLRQNVDVDRIIVFDDLARCEVPMATRLGALNHYVEHGGCKVILIAHEGRIAEEIRSTKEKIIGQTLRVVPQVDLAFQKFVETISRDLDRSFVEKYSSIIKGVFEQSDVGSLRILRHLIEDVVRLIPILKQKHLEQERDLYTCVT